MKASLAAGLVLALVATGCSTSASTRPQQQGPYYGQPNYGQPNYPTQNPGPYQNGQAVPQNQGQPQQPPPQQAQRPLLAPLVGSAAMQQETRSILGELIAALGPTEQSKVRGIPLVFDATLEINAFAGCERGAPFMAGTEGILQAVDAIAQTNATDQMYGTRTYDAYLAAVVPRLARGENTSPALPMGSIPLQYLAVPQRLSRAREIFQEVMAFTFGHELAHHYLGHTGCANGQAMAGGPALATLGNLVTSVVPFANQPNESAADVWGANDALDAGLRRTPASYRWSERGGLLLLEFFAKLESAAGASGNIFSPTNLLRTHPNPGIRIPVVRGIVQQWYMRHPGVSS